MFESFRLDGGHRGTSAAGRGRAAIGPGGGRGRGMDSQHSSRNVSRRNSANRQEGSSTAPLEWHVDFTDCLIIAPRNSWSMDAIAVSVSAATLEGMTVHRSWSAPSEILQTSCDKYLYFDPRKNEWLFEAEPLLSPVDCRSPRSEMVYPSLHTASMDSLATEARSEADMASSSLMTMFAKEVDMESSGDDESDGDDRKSKGSSRRSSVHSIATSMYESCDDLDNFGETRSRSESGSRSQKSRISSHDGHEEDLFFDTYDHSPGKPDDKKTSVRFTIPPTAGFGRDIPDANKGNGDKDSKEKGTEKGQEAGKEGEESNAMPELNRVVLTFRKSELYVSLGSPLHPNREENVADEIREFAEASHHSPVYRVVKKEGRRLSEARSRDRDRPESVFVQKFVYLKR